MQQDQQRQSPQLPVMVGWVWYDDTKDRPITDKIYGALDRYHHKFGRRGNSVFVNAGDLNGTRIEINGVSVFTCPSVDTNRIYVYRLEHGR